MVGWRVGLLAAIPFFLAVLTTFTQIENLGRWIVFGTCVLVGVVIVDIPMVSPSVDQVNGIPWRAIIIIPVASILSVGCYRGAVFAAQILGENISRMVDLYRLQLIQQLGFTIPRNVREERELFSELRTFFSQAMPLKEDRRLVLPPIRRSSE